MLFRFGEELTQRPQMKSTEDTENPRALARRPAVHLRVAFVMKKNRCGADWLEEFDGYALGGVAYGDQGDQGVGAEAEDGEVAGGFVDDEEHGGLGDGLD